MHTVNGTNWRTLYKVTASRSLLKKPWSCVGLGANSFRSLT